MTAEEPEFDDAAGARADGLQFRQRGVEVEDVDRPRVGADRQIVIEGDPFDAAAALPRAFLRAWSTRTRRMVLAASPRK